MSNRSNDDEIKMEKRRIREVELCVTSQEEIVVRLDLIGADDLSRHGHELLARFHEFLAIARARLVYLEEKWSANAPQSNQDATDDIRQRADFAEELSR